MGTDHAMNLQQDLTNVELYKTFQHYKNVEHFHSSAYSLSSTFFPAMIISQKKV